MSWGYSGPSSYAENPLKKREDALWEEFARTGVMPEVPVLDVESKIHAAHAILEGEYNQLQKVLDGEALARRGILSVSESEVQLEAAGWVLRIINSAKRNYANKEAMSNSFLAFKAASQNKRMTLTCGLDKGCIMLRNAPDEKKIGLAEKFLLRLDALAVENAGNIRLEEFTRLAISVGWTFAKANRYESLAKVVKLLPDVDYGMSEYFQKNINALHDKMRFAEEEPLRAWMTKAKAAVSPDSSTAGVQSLLLELLPLVGIGGWYQGPVPLKDGGQFEARHVALMRVCQLAKKFKNGMPTACAQTILQLFKKDGLQNFSSLFYERRGKALKPGEQLSPRAKPFWPSLAEDIAKQLVSSCKACYGRKTDLIGEGHPDLEWAVNYLESTYSRFTDDEWADFRMGKVLVWSGLLDRAKERLLPVIRKKQTEYWAWDLLGDLFPAQRKSCVAKALLCEAEDIYTKGLKAEATQMGLNPSDKESLANASEPVLDLLLSGINPVDGILLERFKTPEGKKRLVFSDGTGKDTVPLSPKAARLGNDIAEGCPVTLYRAPEDEKQIVAVKLRTTGSPWDVLPVEHAVYVETFSDKNGKRITALAIKGIRFLSFNEIKGCVPGTPMKVRFSDHIRDGKDPECVWTEKDVSPERHPWDVMDTVKASFVESYSNDKGVVNVFAREGTQYKSYGEIDTLEPGDPVDIFVLGAPDKERVYHPSPWAEIRRPGTFIEAKPDTKCYAITPSSSPDRFKWDAMYRAVVVYCGTSRSGTSFTLSSGKFKFNAPRSKFDILEKAILGASFEIRYKVRVKDGEKIRDVVACKTTDENPGLTTSYSGTIRMATGSPPVGYVDLYDDSGVDYYDYDDDYREHEQHPYGSVFVAAPLVERCKLIGGENVSGTAVRLPSKYHTSRKGHQYENKCYQAISIDVDKTQEAAPDGEW